MRSDYLQYYISHYNKEPELNFPDEITIYDTTLRDGEQTPGVCFSPEEKLEIAKKLDEIKIKQIEAGFPIVSKKEQESVKSITSEGLNAQILSLARTKKEDIDAALDCDVDGVITFMGTSDIHLEHKMHIGRQEALNTCMNAIEYAKDHGLFVAFSAEDATRTEHDYLFDVYDAVVDAGADFLNVPDTVGVLIPVITKELITNLKERYTTPISVHFHNDFGLATANTLTAIECGADQAHVTVNGMGERTGNASLEELIVALHAAYNIDLNIDTTQLYSLSEFVGRITGIKMPVNKPIVGANAFAHESGIHVHGVLNNALTYEPISPELVGHSRRIVLGKHTGANAVKAKLEKYNIDLTEEQFQNVFDQIKALGDKGKTVTDDDLRAIAITEISSAKETPIKLEGLGILSGAIVSPTATVKLNINGKLKETSCTGVGPVDAAINAIRELIQDTMDIELEEYNLEAITGGTDALAEVFVISSDGEGNKSTGRATNDDVIMASILAVLDSINKILLMEKN